MRTPDKRRTPSTCSELLYLTTDTTVHQPSYVQNFVRFHTDDLRHVTLSCQYFLNLLNGTAAEIVSIKSGALRTKTKRITVQATHAGNNFGYFQSPTVHFAIKHKANTSTTTSFQCAFSVFISDSIPFVYFTFVFFCNVVFPFLSTSFISVLSLCDFLLLSANLTSRGHLRFSSSFHRNIELA